MLSEKPVLTLKENGEFGKPLCHSACPLGSAQGTMSVLFPRQTAIRAVSF
jgi:hypothetical protein